MIYRVMSVCWKACGARLLSSQGQRRGGKKGNRKLLAFVLKGNSTPVCVLPRRLFPKQSVQAKTDAVAFCGSRAEHRMGYSGGTPVSCSFMNGHLSSRRGFLPHVSWEFSRILLCNRSFPWPGWIFNWLPKKYLLDTWGWTTHWTEEQTCSRLFFFIFLQGVGWGGEDGLGAVRLAS